MSLYITFIGHLLAIDGCWGSKRQVHSEEGPRCHLFSTTILHSQITHAVCVCLSVTRG